MSNIKDLSKFRSQSFRHTLNTFYNNVSEYKVISESTFNRKLTEDEIKSRAMFFRKVRGEFVMLFRIKNSKSEEQIADFVGWTLEEYKNFESGKVSCPDAIFFRICKLVQADSEVSVFLEKIEEAFTPGLCEARKTQAEELKSLGIVFADKGKYEKGEKGKIFPFLRKSPKKSD